MPSCLRITDRRPTATPGPSLIAGELDLSSADELDTTIAELCADGARHIVLEMSELEFMDSTGLRSVLVGAELCAVSGCELLIGSTSRQVERLLSVAGVASGCRGEPGGPQVLRQRESR